jgi:hypothetical protein
VTICNPWRVGNSLNKLLDQINQRAPRRDKGSDGGIGDTAHQDEACASQHNSCCIRFSGIWIVRARDFTHDPAGGFDSYACAEQLRLSRDPRIRYLISNRRITGPSYGWAWHDYSGSDPHTNHLHVSVFDDQAKYDNTADWRIVAPSAVPLSGGETMFVRIQDGDPGAGAIYFAAPGALTGLTSAVWNAFKVKPGFTNVPASFIAALQGTVVNDGTDVITLTPADIATLAHAVAAEVATDPSVPISDADADVLAEKTAAAVRAVFAAQPLK